MPCLCLKFGFGKSKADKPESTGWKSTGAPTKLFVKKGQEQDKVVAVLVTISEGRSYDENFKQIEPRTVPGERVSTYFMRCSDVFEFRQYLAGDWQAPVAPSPWAELLHDIRSVAPDSVTFNWECCSACNDDGFICARPARSSRRTHFRFGWSPSSASPTVQLMGLAVRRGYTVMCSDFSLKALLSEWCDELLGPNPFVKMHQVCAAIGDEGLAALAERLPQQLQDFRMYLSGTKVGDEGLAALAERLPKQLRYFTMTLSATKIGDEGLAALAERLPTQLQDFQMYLGDTQISDEGLKSLAAHLPPPLQRLEMYLPDVDVSTFYSGLAEHSPAGLADLRIYKGQVSASAYASLCAKVAQHMQQLTIRPGKVTGAPSQNTPLSGDLPQLFAAVRASADLGCQMCVKLLTQHADKMTRDESGATLHDVVAATRHPELASLIERPTAAEALWHAVHHRRFVAVVLLCAASVGLALCLARREAGAARHHARAGKSGGAAACPSQGEVMLAAKATFTATAQRAARLFRFAEVLAAVICTTVVLWRMHPGLAFPVCLAAYGGPVLLDGQAALAAPWALQFTAARTTLLGAARRRQRAACKLSLPAARLGFLLALAALAESGLLPGWASSTTAPLALARVADSRQDHACMQGAVLPDALRRIGWQPWHPVRKTDDCRVLANGCMHGEYYCEWEASALTAPWANFSDDGAARTTGYEPLNLLRGMVPPTGGWTLAGTICPAEALCLRLPTVRALWQGLRTLALVTLAVWALGALGLALAPAYKRLPEGTEATTRVAELAERIQRTATRQALADLSGLSGAVQPTKMSQMAFTLAFVFADVLLDVFTVYTLLANEDVYFAGLLTSIFLYSATRELYEGNLKSLPKEVKDTLRRGVVADGVQSVLNNERGTEAMLSLFVTAYALPFTIKSPVQAVVCPLSVAWSAFGLSTFLHEYVDLAGATADDEGSETTSSDETEESGDSSSSEDSKA